MDKILKDTDIKYNMLTTERTSLTPKPQSHPQRHPITSPNPPPVPISTMIARSYLPIPTRN